jgi:CBS domain-containing protein
VFALVDVDVQPDNVLSVRELTGVRPDRRARTRLRDLSSGVRPVAVTPDTPLIDVLPAISRHAGIAVVVEDGLLIATVAVRDIETLAQMATPNPAATDRQSA